MLVPASAGPRLAPAPSQEIGQKAGGEEKCGETSPTVFSRRVRVWWSEPTSPRPAALQVPRGQGPLKYSLICDHPEPRGECAPGGEDAPWSPAPGAGAWSPRWGLSSGTVQGKLGRDGVRTPSWCEKRKESALTPQAACFPPSGESVVTPLPLGEGGALPEPVEGRPEHLLPFRRRTPRATQSGISRGN